MEEFIETYIPYLIIEMGLAQGTAMGYKSDLLHFLSYLEEKGTNQWAEVDLSLLSGYMHELHQKELKPATISRKLSAIRSFFHYLLTKHQIDTDPSSFLDNPKQMETLPNVLSDEDITRILDTLASPKKNADIRDLAMLELLYACGLRVSELIRLNMNDIDLDACYLR